MSRRKNKTICDCVEETIRENGCPGIMWGDCHLLDESANKATHTNLMTLHPMDRHQRILNALDHSKRFKKSFVDLPGKVGNNLVRYFELIEDVPKQ